MITGKKPEDSREVPASSDHAQRGIGESWCFGDGREIENMPLIDRANSAIAAVKTTAIRIRVALKVKLAAGVRRAPWIADAVRPRVVGIECNAACGAPLDGNQKGI